MTTTHLLPFECHPLTRLVFSNGAVGRLGELARALGGSRVLVVTDPGVVAAGHAERSTQALTAARLSVTVFTAVRENPTTADVARCVEAARVQDIDLLVGLGGGSAIDTAKGCNFILTNGGQMSDYWGIGKATKPMLPLIAVPTTAGTGSECQSAALIADEHTHQKMACLDPKAAPRVALLDPELTLSLPPRVTAVTGIDALAHAVESAVTTKRTPISGVYAQEAFRLCASGFPRVWQQPRDLAARGQMLLGAALAGWAIENSMLGAAHSAANPLTAHGGLVHGHAVGLMLPHVVRYNGLTSETRALYAELARAARLVSPTDSDAAALTILARWLEEMLDLAALPRSLAECGVARAGLSALAAEAAQQWTARFNPRPVSSEDFLTLYETAWSPA
jgi:alcohol dehydrogenase